MTYQLVIVVIAKSGSAVAISTTGSFTTIGQAETERSALLARFTAPVPPTLAIGSDFGLRIEVMRKT